jgi:hypothetical protein
MGVTYVNGQSVFLLPLVLLQTYETPRSLWSQYDSAIVTVAVRY